MKSFLVTFVAMLFVIFLGALEIYMVNGLIKSVQVESWPTTQGKIIDSDVSQGRKSSSVKATFKYRIEDQEFTGSKVRPGVNSSKSSVDIQEMLNRYAPGKTVPVFYNAKDPSESYLEGGVTTVGVIVVISPLIFLYFCIRIICEQIRGKKPDTTTPSGSLASDAKNASTDE